MKKYLSIFKMSLSDNFQGIPALVLRFVGYFVNMLALTSVWKFIYSDPSQIINGYSLNQMIWYILFAETIQYAVSRNIQTEIQADIVSGSIAYKVNKPYRYVLYILSRSFADSLIRIILYTVVSIAIGLLFIGPIESSYDVISILCITLTFILSIIITSLIKITITLSAFWVEDSNPFHWVYSKLMLVFGIFFPIEMFPLLIQKVLVYTPVYTTIYGPSKLAISFNYTTFVSVLLAQIIYIIVVSLLCTLIYRKGVKKLNVNGG